MKMIKFLSFLATIIFIPLGSRQHFIPFLDLNQCLLADICNHTWIPECGFDAKHSYNRLFIDECDMFEFNCDFNMMFKLANYSDCFGFNSSCPTGPSLLTKVQGFHIYYANGRRVMYSHTMPQRKGTTHYMPPITASTRTTNWHERRRYTPQATGHYKPWSWFTTNCAPCQKLRTYVQDLRETRTQTLFHYETPPIELFTKATTKRTTTRRTTTRRTTKRTTKLRPTTTKPTTQILRTATIGRVIVKKATVFKHGKKLFKVVKGFKGPITKTIEDSDFLE